MQFKMVDGLALHYAREGRLDGIPLVFINSLGTDFRIWDALIPHFADRFAIVRYDKRGHCLSDYPAVPCSIQTHTDDLDRLLSALGIGSAILIGISVGGMIAVNFAAAHWDRVRALVLCDTGATIGSSAMWNERINTLRARGMESLGEAIVGRW